MSVGEIHFKRPIILTWVTQRPLLVKGDPHSPLAPFLPMSRELILEASIPIEVLARPFALESLLHFTNLLANYSLLCKRLPLVILYPPLIVNNNSFDMFNFLDSRFRNI